MDGELGPVESVDLYVPPVLETAEFLEEELAKHFYEASVRVTSCPDLRKDPFNLVSPGLGGSPFILQIGGVKNLFPHPQKEKIYDLCTLAQAFQLPSITLFGAGGGPLKKLGQNSEAIINFRTGEKRIGKAIVCHNYVAYWQKDGTRECKPMEKPQISYIGDFYASQGLPGRVMQIKLKQRKSDKGADILALLRELLIERFGANRSIGMGGVVLQKRGKAKMHILKPELGDGPLEMEQLFTQFEANAPLVGLCMIMTNDCGIKMNQTHMHMFNRDGQGGHWHEDVSPDSVEYEAYFSFGNRAVHFDAPN